MKMVFSGATSTLLYRLLHEEWRRGHAILATGPDRARHTPPEQYRRVGRATALTRPEWRV
jgi:hypothetical protein